MDLRRYGKVFRRWWIVLSIGLFLAVIIGFLAAFRVGSDGVEFRSSETWEANQDLLLTARGFPLGRARVTVDPGNAGGVVNSETASESARLVELAGLYTQLSSSDGVIARMEEESGQPIDGEVSAVQFQTPGSNAGLPAIRLEALASTSEGAIDLARLNSSAFSAFLRDRQRAAKIPASEQVVLATLREAEAATKVSSRSIVAPVVAFLAVLGFTLGLIFLLENLYPVRTNRTGPEQPTPTGVGGEHVVDDRAEAPWQEPGLPASDARDGGMLGDPLSEKAGSLTGDRSRDDG